VPGYSQPRLSALNPERESKKKALTAAAPGFANAGFNDVSSVTWV